MRVRDRIPQIALRTVATHPISAARQLVGLLAVWDQISSFAHEDRSTIDEWLRQLLEDSGLPTQIRARWKSLDRADWSKHSVGGSIGVYNEVLYLLVRSARPKTVVETGVALGFTSAYILQALKDGGGGRLISIDRPNTNPSGYVASDGTIDSVYLRSESELGFVVPVGLRSGWELIRGSSNPALKNLLEREGEIDVFFHDSEHSASNMLWEYRTAWPHISSNGLLLSDDINCNHAFHNFSSEVNRVPCVWLGGSGRCGALRRGLT